MIATVFLDTTTMSSTCKLIFCLMALHCAAVSLPERKADWCRHVTIVSRPEKSSTKSTGCYIPVQPAYLNSISLRKTIDQEWQWSLNLPHSSNGQAFIVGKNTVTFLSQKVCLDAGTAVGHPFRPLYASLDNNSHPIGYIGDFQKNPSFAGDIYSSCVENPTSWRNFTFKSSLCDKGMPMPESATQYLQVRAGGHEGIESKLVPFEFNYTSEQLEEAFETALNLADARNKKTRKRAEDEIQSGKPVILNKLPFEIGHTRVAIRGETKLYRDLFDDITIVGWNRLLEAVASLAGRPAPPLLLPESIEEHDIMAITVLAVISIITFKQALSTVASARRTDVKQWDPPRRNKNLRDWALVRTATEHSQMAKYQPPFSTQDLSGPSIAFLVAMVTIIGAMLHFRSSSWRYNKFIVVRQGGLMTYGPSNSSYWSYDAKNGLAGATLVVGHWYVAQIIEVGHPGLFELIAGMYSILIFLLFSILYKFSTLREHKLDKQIFRVVLHGFRAFPQAVIGGLLRLFQARSGVWFLSSYRSTYFNLAKALAEKYELSVTPKDIFSKRWDGQLVPPPRSSNRSALQDSIDSEEGNDVRVTEDDVEKAAAFLAADRFGRLEYVQVIGLLSCSRLLRAADMYRNFGDLPRAIDIRGFAQLFYVTAIILPERSEKYGIPQEKFKIVDIGNEPYCLAEIRQNVAMLLALPPGHKGGSLDGHGFAVL